MSQTTNQIGLENSDVKELIDKLNDLLANYQVFYQNTRGFHWNIKGHKFFELHVKFEELYDDLHAKIDEIAERILTLGGTPLHSFADYTSISDVKAIKDASEDVACVTGVLDALKVLLVKQRVILDLSDKMDDEGTNAMASDYIREQEKLVWMYSSWLNK
ncbi:MAG: DNA starvation/stationary phase protection protein [Bacteroidetes bacterium]|nr:MAG: DNA starvation/stationary phase protection protein [Bacteroidota bacterium]